MVQSATGRATLGQTGAWDKQTHKARDYIN